MESFERLETELQEWSGMPHVVVCSSGTAALHLSLEVLDLPPGSEVIVPDMTMVACARAVRLAGLEPVLVDCDNLLLMDGKHAETAMGFVPRPGGTDVNPTKVKAIMPVHIYGRRCDFDGLLGMRIQHTGGSLGDPNYVYVVEDLAEAHGVTPWRHTDAACWSFYKNKLVRGDEGGAIGFRDPALAAKARQLRCLGFTDRHDFQHIPRGHNYRLANVLADKVLDSLSMFAANVWLRRLIEAEYESRCPEAWRMPPREVPWIYDLRIPGMDEVTQDRVIEALHSAGIGARHCFRPMSEQEEFKGCRLVGNGNAARLSKTIIYLPLTPGLVTEGQVEQAFEVIKSVVG